MTRFLLLAVPFFTLAGLLPAAPVPRDSGKQEYYFPTRVGTKWVYKSTGGHGWGAVITKSEEKNGRFLITVKATSEDFHDDESITLSQYAVSKDGVFLVADDIGRPDCRLDFDPPSCILKLPYKVGEKWEGHPKTEGPTYVTGKVESVKVAIGAFEAVRVDRGENHTSWYAPNFGLIRFRDKDNIYEMKSFTLPKE